MRNDAVVHRQVGGLIILTRSDGTAVRLVVVDPAVVNRHRTAGNTDSTAVAAGTEGIPDFEIGDFDVALDRSIDSIFCNIDTSVLTASVDNRQIIPALLGKVGIPATAEGLVLVDIVEMDAAEYGTALNTDLGELLRIVDCGLEILASHHEHRRDQADRTADDPFTFRRYHIGPDDLVRIFCEAGDMAFILA